jgi:hypothetical protein
MLSGGGYVERHANLHGVSAVVAYEIDSDSITVKELAARGQGLNSFINTNVKKAYSKKFRQVEKSSEINHR